MLPHTGRRRAAFTLIELLVVLAIIAIIVSLTTAAVQRVRALGVQTENTARMAQIADALGRLKNDLKIDYVPSDEVFELKGTYNPSVAGDQYELKILLRAFPNMNHVGNPGPGNDTNNGYTGGSVNLDGNQVLCLFLTGGVNSNYAGFSNNPRKPFAPPSGAEQRKGPWLNVNPKLVSTGPPVTVGGGGTVTGTPGQAWLVDAYGIPLAYFASVDAAPNNYGTTQRFRIEHPTTVVPAPNNISQVGPYLSGGRAVNEKGFQIISAGRDKVFGPGGGNLPATGSPGGEDDQAHFTKGVLGGGLN